MSTQEAVLIPDAVVASTSSLRTSPTICAHGTLLTIRPVEPTDVEGLARMFGRLSRESIYYRFFSPLPQVPPSTLRRVANVDHSHRDALVVLDGADIVAIASYDELPSTDRRAGHDAEIAVTVDDAWQHQGIGLRLGRHLAALALERGYDTFVAKTLPTNRAALRLIRKLAPEATVQFASGVYDARLPLATSLARPNPNALVRRV
jgi:RimJ/RimL family protein N-acetyltransferase